jgi:hypothetical protein
MPASDATVGSGLAEDRQSLYSMDFGGTGDYIDCGSPTIFDDLTSFSFSCWFNSNVKGNDDGILGKWNTGTDRSFALNLETSGNIRFIVRSGGVGAQSYINTSDWSTGNWYNVIGTYDGSNVKLYLDGVLKDTVALTGTVDNATQSFRIGRYGASSDFNGNIDEVAIWNRALSASEISALSTANAPANILALSDKPVAYWPLGEQARRGSEWQFPNEVLQSQVFDFQTTLWANGSSASQLWVISKFEDDLIIYGGTSTKYYRKNNLFSINTWYNLIVVYDGSQANADRFKAYLNGDLLTGATINGTIETITPTFTTNLNIGRIGYAAASYFNGKMSNVAFWNSDQSANISNIYNNGSPQSSYTTTPTAWYKLNATSNYAGLNPNFHNVDFGNPTELQLTGALTFSGWIKTSSSTYQLMISKDDVANRCFNFGLLNTGEVYGQVFNSGSATTVQTTTTWKDGDWHHIAFVYIPSVSIEIFVDGNSEKLSTTSIPASIDNDPANFNIGRRTDGARYFNGSISNVAIFNQNISSEDVLYLYNGGTPQTNISFEPVSWWKLDNLTTGIQDSGSASNNGTNNGATEVTDSVAVDQWNFDNVSQAQTPNQLIYLLLHLSI